jgi:hypothetical protein
VSYILQAGRDLTKFWRVWYTYKILHKISQEADLAHPALFGSYNTSEQFSKVAEHPAVSSWLAKWEVADDADWEEIVERTKEVSIQDFSFFKFLCCFPCSLSNAKKNSGCVWLN